MDRNWNSPTTLRGEVDEDQNDEEDEETPHPFINDIYELSFLIPFQFPPYFFCKKNLFKLFLRASSDFFNIRNVHEIEKLRTNTFLILKRLFSLHTLDKYNVVYVENSCTVVTYTVISAQIYDPTNILRNKYSIFWNAITTYLPLPESFNNRPTHKLQRSFCIIK